MQVATCTRWMVAVAVLQGCGNAATTGGEAADTDVTLGFQDVAADVQHDALLDVASDAQADSWPDVGADGVSDASLPQTCPGAAGCSCTGAADCANGLCLDTPDGKRCGVDCGTGCPSGQTCTPLAGAGGKTFSVCVLTWGKLCYPCDASQDCQEPGVAGSLCVEEGSLGSFCGALCKTTTDCPSGYDCQVAQSPEGPKSLQCVRVTSDGTGIGTCSCTAAAKAAGLSTVCYAEQKDLSGKVVGKCPGSRQCGPTGLGSCTLVAVKPDVCDGVDNDCNGVIDDGVSGCSVGETCVGGKCAGGCGANNGGCDANATCTPGTGGITCSCNPGFSGDGKSCLADCALPWGGSLANGKSVTAWHDASIICGGACVSEKRTCSNGVLDGSFANAACAVASCPGQCPALALNFGWGVTGSGACHVDLPAGTASNWYFTDKADPFLGGVYATCDTASGTWQIGQQKCVPANGATTCFLKGTQCDGSGPAIFPYPHCWTCCNATDPMPGVCN